MKRLLLTGGGGAGNEAIYRLWQDRYDLHFADADPDTIHYSIPAERKHTIPFAISPDFPGSLAVLCRDIGVDLLIPGVDEELSQMRDVQRDNRDLQVMVPSQDYVLNMLDKLRAHHLLSAHGINNPKTVTFDKVKEIGFPCLAKPRKGRGSRGVRIIDNQEQAQAHITLNGGSEQVVLAQELLLGQEYTVMMVADSSQRLRAIVPVKVVAKRGITIAGETEDNHEIIKACENIHEKLPTVGCYNVQLMLTRDGRIMVFEINPRISTTFCLGVAAGVDPVSIFLGEPGNSVDTYKQGYSGQFVPFKAGVQLRRYWFNHFVG